MLADHGELLFKADEMNFIAIRLEPARPAMWVPSLLAGGSAGERDGGGLAWAAFVASLKREKTCQAW